MLRRAFTLLLFGSLVSGCVVRPPWRHSAGDHPGYDGDRARSHGHHDHDDHDRRDHRYDHDDDD